MTKKRTDIVNFRLLSGLFCIISFLFFARSASAQVVINEIAWMGTTTSTANEWIELVNVGDSFVDLSGWVLSGAGKKDISLVGGIKGGGFYLIERTDDTTVPSVEADLVASFVNGISNTGTIIYLRNAKGEEIDSVNGSDGWKVDGVVVGNSLTKETAQRGINGWLTGTPTPGSSNSSQASNTVTTETQSLVTVMSSASDSFSYFDTTMYTRIVVQSGSFISGAPIIFTGEAVDAKKKQIDSVYYLWAFGDGETGSGKTASHIFRYPGSYVVTLTVSSSQGATAVTTTTKIAIFPALLRASIYEEGSSAVNIANDSSKDIDLSSWAIDIGSRRFTIPEHTILSAHESIILAPETTGFRSPISFVNIFYPNGKPYEQAKKDLPVVTPKPQTMPVEFQTKASVVKSASVATVPNTAQQTEMQDLGASVSDAFTSQYSENSSPSQNGDGLWLWYTSAALLGAVALWGLRFTRESEKKNTFTADDFTISEVADEIPDDEYDTDEPH